MICDLTAPHTDQQYKAERLCSYRPTSRTETWALLVSFAFSSVSVGAKSVDWQGNKSSLALL